MAALIVLVVLLAVAGWVQAFRVSRRLVDLSVYTVRLESRVLPDVPIYEQMGGRL